MRTPREIVEPMYDGADYQEWRMLGMTCGALEELISVVQTEAVNASKASDLNTLKEMVTKTHMKPGDKIPILLTVIKSVEYGDNWNGEKLENLRGNLFWACPKGCKGPFIVVCDDNDTECKLIQRKAIVDLLECGVGS